MCLWMMLIACGTKPGQPTDAPPLGADTAAPTRPSAPTAATASTASTGATGTTALTSHTGHTGDSGGGPPRGLAGDLGPSTIVLPSAPGELVPIGVMPRRDGPDQVVVLDGPTMVNHLLRGPFPAGEHVITALWDGVSTLPLSHLVPASDVDGDGSNDAWVGLELHAGPLPTTRPPLAVLPGTGWGAPLVSDADLDGDGHVDLLLHDGSQLRPVVLFGPLDGAPQPIARLGPTSYEYLFEVGVFRDHYGPGAHAVGMWAQRSKQALPYELFDGRLLAPGGDYVEPAFTVTGWVSLSPLGDVDGDGFGDMGFGSTVLRGPLQPEGGAAPASDVPHLVVDGGFVIDDLGDLDGDGAVELLVVDASRTEYSVLMSPHSDPIDVAGGVRIGLVDHTLGEAVVGDVDGDGLPDLLVQSYFSGGSELHVYTGADVVAAKAP